MSNSDIELLAELNQSHSLDDNSKSFLAPFVYLMLF